MIKDFICTDDRLVASCDTACPATLYVCEILPNMFADAVVSLRVHDSCNFVPIVLNKEMLIQLRDWINAYLQESSHGTYQLDS